MNRSYQYTLAGVAAIVLWSAVMGLVRAVTEMLGPVGGAASIYTVAAVFLVLVMGVPRLREYSPRYVLIGGSLFVAYEICLALALAMANTRQQALEMLVINYLWPALTVLMAVITSGKKSSIWVYPGILLAFFGVAWSITGEQGMTPEQLMANIASNPTTYAMALTGAFLWAVYCVLTKRIANGQNAITLFFLLTAMSLWVKYTASGETPMVLTMESVGLLLISGVALGSGYALWNYAIIGGNMVLLATLSYFTPVLSTALSSLILGLVLTQSFMQGVCMVTAGSLLCWWVTRAQFND
ncbi:MULTISPECIES: aromatic amino acid DMT transporter YddG [unclassified Pseudoalteromonas]|uniref:aromatic amino acid DMT transporter YddG n=1 Tax=unclassified Pseudoalteromonas TaxID=194690 RepID=UPI002097A177|nr:aromatic amino acid DMT transporter YddG [Pseudoalteromonas sp. XMcav2-N]MCO7188892.1 aromatic amino acid DMT transporter YddG [Pseudoalteromonas sp. XMcav2-N]